ncbi:MAG: hypothetical protein SGI87_13970 [Flavobacteriales bacterium]|nr:hypothetical protein [Flavobacteriales bacterium]
MKKTILLSLAVMIVSVSLISCGGGWTEENKTDMKSTCGTLMKMSFTDEDAATICDCYIEGLVKKYPKADFTPEQNSAEIDACSADATKKKEEEAQLKLEQSLQKMEAGLDSAIKATEDVLEGEKK